ncbi:unnamed protein product, partial [Polarella glacialis]
RGFAKEHDGRCVTVFSASNYCGNGGNYGAVIVIAAQNFPRYEVFEHFAAPLKEMASLIKNSPEKGAGKDWNEIASAQQKETSEASAVDRAAKQRIRMITCIIEKKPQLYSHILDMSLGTSLTVDAWVEVVSELVEGNHAWAEAAEEWELKDANGKIE